MTPNSPAVPDVIPGSGAAGQACEPDVQPLEADPLGKTVKDGHDPACLAGSRTCVGFANPYRAEQQKPDPVDWMDWALCREVDPELFHPPKGKSTAPAKRICARCPVRAECLEDALRRHEPEGVFGGLSPNERRDLAGMARKKAQVAARRREVQRLVNTGYTSAQIAVEMQMTERMVHRDRAELRRQAAERRKKRAA